MMEYLCWKTASVPEDPAAVTAAYSRGFVFGRAEKNQMHQTRSVRIDLSIFEESSENRRILRKTEGIHRIATPLPLPEYHWSLGKLAKDFYSEKFGDGTFSANKFKEIVTEKDKSNFTTLFIYSLDELAFEAEACGCHMSRLETDQYDHDSKEARLAVGYAICYENDDILHYSYPFYDLHVPEKNMGMGMMVRAVAYAKATGKKYIYLGSAQRSTDTYKLQFKGMEWFDGAQWHTDLDALKEAIT